MLVLKSVLLLSAMSVFLCLCTGERILGLFGFSSRSHNHVFGALTSELAKRGHELTVVTPFPLYNPPGKYKQINVPVIRKLFNSFDSYDNSDLNIFQTMMMVWEMGKFTCPKILNVPEVKQLLKEKFDLVIISIFFNECTLPFAYINQAPFIFISPSGSAVWSSESMGNPELPSYIPNLYLPYSDHMNFYQRTFNTIVGTFIQITRQYNYLNNMNYISQKFFGDEIPSLADLERNASLAFINNHVSLNYPRPLLPNVVDIGGMHVQQKTQPLPQDVQSFLDEAKEGAIYFSMGSMLRGDRLPREILQSFLDAFSELPYKVLWKWESDFLLKQPRNVKFGKWLPQQDVLAHSNIRLFIMQGGLLSIQEAAYHGVPIIGIPISGDQDLNVKRAEVLGVAASLKFETISKQALLDLIREVFSNSNYTKAASELKIRVQDQPQTPLDRAVFWTEYVLRHKGAPHLRSAAMHLAWYQLYLLDVAVVFLLVILLFLFISKEVFTRVIVSQTINNMTRKQK